MEKMKMHSPNLTQDNIARIRDLFPGCVTEAKGEDGSVKLAVDFDQLRQELTESIVEGPQERYHLNWPGKREALLTANAPIAKTLRPCRDESVDFDTTKNLFIEGDNLDALKLLQETYLGKVKMIYIDPPYNTGNDFIYRDNFVSSKTDYEYRASELSDQGERLVANPTTNGRFHSDWLSMMYPRLKLAKNLLKDSGVIFVSIGQDEVATATIILKEIFGEENFLTICSRVMKKGGQKGVHFSPSVDYIIVIAKNVAALGPFREQIGQNVIENVYTKIETEGPRVGEKYRSMGLYQAMLEKRANQRYFIECPDGSIVIPPGSTFPGSVAEGAQVTPQDGDGVWRWTYTRFHEEKKQGNIEFIRSDRTSLVNSDGSPAKWNIYYKIWLSDRLEDGQLPGNILEKFESRHSSAELKLLEIPFEFPKPSALIKYLMEISGVSDGEITLDFFAGSGSTGHAAIEMAAERNESRPFICVQLPEKTKDNSEEYKGGFRTIADISKERIRRAGKKVATDLASGNLDTGFRVLKIDTSNIADVYYTPDALDKAKLDLLVDNIKPDRTPEDLLFQVMLDWGVDLALPITKQSIQGKDVFFVDGNALAACFDASGSIDEAFVKELAKQQSMRVVFRDAGYKNSAVKINVEQIFKLLSPATEVKCI